ncbi:hypothetical protein BAU15_01270 [Enterococcus sp. JM4C]|uniref:AraC family transcriptional regulator n=1 Tax=Candidatus Enterococcus huntleyi TaxID=1857217 RepID=UPI00137A4536|nr:AraC family transcriptional regulator [Enterococcus sp. JM4C]KAF1299305.1 hypothetical protein BAU15_01270 [Enterococcus sp. JM4C]
MIHRLNELEVIAKTLPLYVLNLGYAHPQEKVQRSDDLDLFQWFFCEKGIGEVIIGSEKMIIKKGEGFLIYPGIRHEYRATVEPWVVSFVGFKGTLCSELLRSLNQSSPGAYHFSDTRTFPKLIRQMSTCYQSKNRSVTKISTLCYELLLNLSKSIIPIGSEEYGGTHSLVDQIILYIEQNYHRPINLDDIATYCDKTKEYICVVFKNNTQQTINHFLTNTRIAQARVELLQYPDKRVYQIAKECGFEDTSYFCKVFKKNTGTSPERFRKIQ